MRFYALAGMAVAVLLAVPANQARADEAAQSAQYAKRLFAAPLAAQGKTYVCFARRYDAAHLAQHKAQKVTQMTLLVGAEMVPEDKALNYSFSVGVDFRNRKGKFVSSGDCGHPVASEVSADKLQLGCGVDCDGGGLSIEMANADKSVLVRIDRMSMWDESKPDADERAGFDAGADDKVFRLDRVDLEQCKPLMPKDDDTAESM